MEANLLANTLDCAVEGTEQTTPNTEVTTKHRSSGLDSCESTYAAFTVGAVAETFDTVPDSTTDSLEIEKKYPVSSPIFDKKVTAMIEDIHPCRKHHQNRSKRHRGRDPECDPLCLSKKRESRVRKGDEVVE
jgi:hypothetical protein